MTWLASLPVGVLVACSLAFAFAIVVLSRFAVRAFVPTDDRDHVQAIAAPLMPALGATFAVLMALTLASEAGYLRSAQDIVSNEASQASRLAWAATSPGVDAAPIHSALTDYLRATRAHEWRGSGKSERADPATARAIARLERVVRAEAARPALGTPASTELLTSLDGLTTARRERLAAASCELPVLYVITLVASGVALIVNAGALDVPLQFPDVAPHRRAGRCRRAQPGAAVRPQRTLGRSAHRERTADRHGRARPQRWLLPRLGGLPVHLTGAPRREAVALAELRGVGREPPQTLEAPPLDEQRDKVLHPHILQARRTGADRRLDDETRATTAKTVQSGVP